MEKKIKRREFFKKAAKGVGILLGGLGIYEFLKHLEKQQIDNAAEGIYFALTGKKESFPSITQDNFREVLNKLKSELETVSKIKIEYFEFNDIKEGLKKLKENNDKLIIVLLWPSRDYPPTIEPSLGIAEKIFNDGFEVWDPNVSIEMGRSKNVTYRESLEKWREKNRPLVFLILDTGKVIIPEEVKIEIQKSILSKRERP